MVAMSDDLASTLDQCLSQIESGKARLRSCLLAYPSRAEELEPLLFAAEALRAGPKPELSPEAESRIAMQVFGRAAVASRPARRAEGHGRSRPNRSWAFAALSALLFVAVLSSSGLAYAATGALPGSALYSAKLATEAAWLWIAPEREEAALHLRFAERRLGETEALAAQGVIEPTVLETMARHVEDALQAAQALPEERGVPVLESLVALSGKQEQALSRLMGRVRTEERVHLEQALQVCRQQGLQARGAVDAWTSPLPGRQGLGLPANESRPPGQEETGPAPQAPSEEPQVPPGQQKPVRDADDGASKDDKKDKDQDEKEDTEVEEQEQEAGEEETEAEEEEKEAEEEEAEESEEEEKEAEEEEKEAEEEDKEAEEEEKEAEEEEKEDEKEEKEEEKEEKEDEKEEEKEEDEEEKEKDKDKD